MYPELSLLIDGEWIGQGGRRSLSVTNPATGEEIGQLPVATLRDIDQAAKAAASAFAGWKSETPFERARILLRIAELLRRDAATIAPILTMEQGKPLREAQAEISGAADIFEWMAEEGKRVYGRIVGSRIPGADQMIFRQAVGPIAAFAPWNFPVILSSRKIATALAAGCTVVIKPAEETPRSLVALARICMEAGLPPGVLNVVFGEPSEISESLIKNPIIRKVSFTGSVTVGRHLATLAGKEMKKITLKLGGHSPVIVMPDVDTEKLADISVAAKVRNAGQVCFSPTRYFVHEDGYAQFVDAFAARASALNVGNGLHDNTEMGPLANERRVLAMRGLTENARSQGAKLVCGGYSTRSDDERGNFWQPTILSDVPDSAEIMINEPFGPIAAIVSFAKLEDAVQRANATDYGLGSYAFTNDAKSARYIQKHIQAGSISINTFAMTPPEMPFAGIKQSGTGVEMGAEGLSEYFDTKSVIWTDFA